MNESVIYWYQWNPFLMIPQLHVWLNQFDRMREVSIEKKTLEYFLLTTSEDELHKTHTIDPVDLK